MYVSEAQSSGVVFNYLVNNRYERKSTQPIPLKGLDPAKKYRIKEINLYPDSKSVLNDKQIYSGEFLMTIGFNPVVQKNRSSVILTIDEIQ